MHAIWAREGIDLRFACEAMFRVRMSLNEVRGASKPCYGELDM